MIFMCVYVLYIHNRKKGKINKYTTLHICLTKSVLKPNVCTCLKNRKGLKGFLICIVNIKIHHLGLDSTETEEIWKQNGPKEMRACIRSGRSLSYLSAVEGEEVESERSDRREDGL